jgi:hypothetical protein
MTITRRAYGTGHSYKLNGSYAPGVTTILAMKPKDALMGWHSRVTAEYAVDHWDELAAMPVSARIKALTGAANAERDAAARKGTQVHRLAEQIVTLPEGAAIDFVPEELAGHVDSYLKFLAEHDPDPIAVELVVASRRPLYCGTADLVAHMDGQVWLLELKTSRSGIWPESALQACAYSRAESYTIAGGDGAEHPLAELGIERCGAVHIRSDGYDLRPLDTGDKVWAYFRHLAALHTATWKGWGRDRKDLTRAWVGWAIEPPL